MRRLALVLLAGLTLGAGASSPWQEAPPALRVALQQAARGLAAAPFEPVASGGGMRRRALAEPRDTLVGIYARGARDPIRLIWTRETLTQAPCANGQPRTVLWMFTAGANGWLAQRITSCQLRPDTPLAPEVVPIDTTVARLALEILTRLGGAP